MARKQENRKSVERASVKRSDAFELRTLDALTL